MYARNARSTRPKWTSKFGDLMRRIDVESLPTPKETNA